MRSKSFPINDITKRIKKVLLFRIYCLSTVIVLTNLSVLNILKAREMIVYEENLLNIGFHIVGALVG